MKKHGIAIILLSLSIALPAAASNWSVFGDTPMTRMSKEDLAAYKKAVIDAAAKGTNGETVAWTGKEPNVSSKITPLRDFTDKGLRCRELRIETEAKELYARGNYTLCKNKGEWGFKSPPVPEKSSKPAK